MSCCCPELVIHGRLLDLQGRPAAGVELEVQRIFRFVDGMRDDLIIDKGLDRLPDAWPRPLVTDADGRLTLRYGLGRAIGAGLAVNSPRFGIQDMIVDTGSTTVVGGPAARHPSAQGWWHIGVEATYGRPSAGSDFGRSGHRGR